LYEDLNVQPQKEGNSLQLQESLTWAEEFFQPHANSEYHKLYDEIDTHRQGRKAAKINVAAAVGLMYTPISNKNFREILMVSNIIPPCTSSMQKTSNQVLNRVVN
jgi:hypothetical protein